jgi:ubiquitin-protein ligase
LPSNIDAYPIIINELTDYSRWRIIVTGRPGTIWEGYVLKGLILFNGNYPTSPPFIAFSPDFKHIHFYSDGRICLNYLSLEHWSYRTTIANLL